MVAHAFFKGLLFLGAGSVIHGLHDEQDLKRMGNLRRYMPLTFWTFTVGWLAIAGIPPLSGFWAKGDVLDAAWAAHPALWVVGLRDRPAHRLLHEPPDRPGLLRQGPLGQAPIDPGDPGVHADHADGPPSPHESPWIMTRPLIDPGRLRLLRPACWPFRATRYSLLKLGGPGLRLQPVQRPREHRRPVGAGHHRRGDRRHRRASSPSPVDAPSGSARARAHLPAAVVVHRRRSRLLIGRPGTRLASSRPRWSRTASSTAPSTGWHPGPPDRRRRPQGPDRVRPKLRPGHRARGGRACSPSCSLGCGGS